MSKMINYKIILASKSFIRIKILKNAGIIFKPVDSMIDERRIQKKYQENEQFHIKDLALALAEEKAMVVSGNYPDKLVIGCDQMLECDDEIFYKPQDTKSALIDLKKLKGKEHNLITSNVCVLNSVKIWQHTEISKMHMRNFTDEFIELYVTSMKNKINKVVAGYEIEGLGIQLFKKIEGDFFSIQGISLFQLLEFLQQSGYIRK
jgi:septum formation protein